jgi:RNA polymerase sigma-70 factor (ECF subfamily)
MLPTATSSTVTIAPELVRRVAARADAERWGLRAGELQVALERSVRHRFPSGPPSAGDLETYVESLHAADLALACACALGREEAWEHFVREFRPVLRRVATRHAPVDAARDVADSIYAELYGLEERDGVRRSLFDYFHGRSSLASWLRAVVAQRLVDRARDGKRLSPLPEAGEAGELSAKTPPPDIDRNRMLPSVRAALKASMAALEPRARLRLSLYYTQGLRLAAIGRAIGESEATASRQLERTRRELRAGVERRLRDDHGMTEREVRESFEHARTDPAFDLARTLPPG